MGIDAGERVVSLACYLSRGKSFSTKNAIREAVDGYSGDCSDEAFERMFENDKDMLRSNGFTITTNDADGYKIDSAASFASELELLPHETAVIRTVGNLALAGADFPFADDLRLALTKIAGALGGLDRLVPPAKAPVSNAGSAAASVIKEAVELRKELEFSYVNSSGGESRRRVHPYGLFRYVGVWYLVAYDPGKAEVRVFNIERMSDLAVNKKSPKTPDFDAVEGFDVAAYMGLPFQYGKTPFRAEVRFSPEIAWQARRIIHAQGTLTEQPDGSVLWQVDASSEPELLRWIIAHGSGITPVAPPSLVSSYAEGLARVEVLHG